MSNGCKQGKYKTNQHWEHAVLNSEFRECAIELICSMRSQIYNLCGVSDWNDVTVNHMSILYFGVTQRAEESTGNDDSGCSIRQSTIALERGLF